MILVHSSYVRPSRSVKADGLVVGGIVDQDVEPAEALDHVVDQLLHLVALGDVALEGRGRDLVAFEVLGDAHGLVLALGVDHGDVAAFLSERVADALAEPAIATGDDGDLALEIHGFPPDWQYSL